MDGIFNFAPHPHPQTRLSVLGAGAIPKRVHQPRICGTVFQMEIVFGRNHVEQYMSRLTLNMRRNNKQQKRSLYFWLYK